MEKALLKPLCLVFLLFLSTIGFSQSGQDVTGQVLYHEIQPMNNVTASLHDATGAVIATTQTNSTGSYTFYNVTPGTYTITFSTAAQPGGINLSDAFAIMLHLLNLYPFVTDVQELAADVNGDGNVTWNDYSYIVVNYLNLGFQFPVGPWVFDEVPPFSPGARDSFTSGGSSSGDVNGTFMPTKVGGMVFQENIVREIAAALNEEIQLAVTSGDVLQIAGMHLVMDIPEGLTVTGINSPLEDIHYAIDGQKLRLTWLDNSLSGCTLDPEHPMFTIHATADNLTTESKYYSFGISDESHFIDLKGDVIPGVHLMLPALKLKLESVVLNTYPNPFMDHATIGYQIPDEGLVIIRLYDGGGKLIEEIENAYLPAGSHQATIEGSELVPGIYHYSISYSGPGSFASSGSIIKSK